MAETKTTVVVEIPTCYADPEEARSQVEEGYLKPMRVHYKIVDVRVE